ncbi:uncharacterized protein PODANS_5_1871 [Podospora anserina S mat+]|uniref:Podospora anserina S mat+ genomic DNA chromosome 5, supercontig 1 n=1 Tax=Podospora anserina (strain S / ATCC MYA-4624 / DSM 980 / FGSC 10383) TaxID=515849 RepID=B2AEP9_PODAN|nr:uncharacterized protein PODANS_5_1871 [Podospora anserina S mat+]CAP61915.1 unnamed protein product [Podospora anserina S mat+]CDP28990.1 Putative protein of unknown function [Podospora anserina S mat+]
MRIPSAIAAILVAVASFSPAGAVPVVSDVEAREADPWGPVCFYVARQPKKPCTYWKQKRQDTPVITKMGPGHVYVPPLRFGGLGHVSVAPLPATRVQVIPIEDPTPAPAPTGKLQVIPIEKRAPEPTFVTTFTVPLLTGLLTPGVTVRPTFKTTITISPEATSTRLSTMTPIRVITVTQKIWPASPIPTFTITSTAPPRSIPTFTITSIPTPAEPTLEKPTNIDLTSTFQPSPTLEVPTNIDPTSTFKPSPPPSPTLITSLNLGPLVPPTTTPTPSPTPIAIPTEGSEFSSQLTFPLLPPVTARALHPSHKEVIIELKPDV